MGDSNSRHLAPKASALPTALIPDLGFEFCARCGQTCGQAVFLTTSTCGGSACIAGVSRDCGHGIFRLEGGATRSQSRRATNCATPGYFVILSGWSYSPKASALPTALIPDIQFLPLYHGGGENQRLFCLWSPAVKPACVSRKTISILLKSGAKSRPCAQKKFCTCRTIHLGPVNKKI